MILNLSHRLSLYQNWAKRFLMFVGDHTLEVLTWHFLSFKLVSLLIIWVYALPIEQLAGFPIIKGYSLMYWPLYSFVGVCVPIGALYIRKQLSYERKQNNLAIIIPAYKATFLAAALDSIAAQTCQDFTLYIGDDCSPNNLEVIVDKYRDKINLVYKRFDTNLGGKDLVAQWERCIDMTQGEDWLWLFSDDDVMEKNCVEEFYKTIKENRRQV